MGPILGEQRVSVGQHTSAEPTTTYISTTLVCRSNHAGSSGCVYHCMYVLVHTILVHRASTFSWKQRQQTIEKTNLREIYMLLCHVLSCLLLVPAFISHLTFFWPLYSPQYRSCVAHFWLPPVSLRSLNLLQLLTPPQKVKNTRATRIYTRIYFV